AAMVRGESNRATREPAKAARFSPAALVHEEPSDRLLRWRRRRGLDYRDVERVDRQQRILVILIALDEEGERPAMGRTGGYGGLDAGVEMVALSLRRLRRSLR